MIEDEGEPVRAAFRDGTRPITGTAKDCPADPTVAGSPTRVHFGCDGVMAPMVTDAEKAKRRVKTKTKRRRPLRRAKAGADQTYKEFKLVTDDDWTWLFCYGRQAYWQANSPGLTRDSAPRVGYALYRISPDSTVLETLVGATEEAVRKAKEFGVKVPAPRAVRVDLVTGKLLDPAAKIADPQKLPGRPFTGDAITGGRGNQANYVPSPDPVRAAGTFGGDK